MTVEELKEVLDGFPSSMQVVIEIAPGNFHTIESASNMWRVKGDSINDQILEKDLEVAVLSTEW